MLTSNLNPKDWIILICNDPLGCLDDLYFHPSGFVSCGSNSIKPHQTNVVLSNPVLEEF